MNGYNNLQEIRNIYGATQEVIAKVADVNRSTISQWETGALKASNTKLEKLSIYYGIGPEFFYEKALTDSVKKMIVAASETERDVAKASNYTKNKAEEFAKLIDREHFIDARSKFVFFMKLFLATADYGTLEDLKAAQEAIKKMSNRLELLIEMREQDNDEESFFAMLDQLI